MKFLDQHSAMSFSASSSYATLALAFAHDRAKKPTMYVVTNEAKLRNPLASGTLSISQLNNSLERRRAIKRQVVPVEQQSAPIAEVNVAQTKLT